MMYGSRNIHTLGLDFVHNRKWYRKGLLYDNHTNLKPETIADSIEYAVTQREFICI